MAGQPFGFGVHGRLEPGTRIAGYVIEEPIGAGGMAMVFRARDETLGRLAAIKVLAPALAADEEFRVRFLRESRAAASVDDPHIIPVYGAGEAEGVLYIATRFVASGDLGALLRRNGGPLDAQRVAALIAQVASALDAAHRVGLVHRDVKPGNVLVDLVPGRAEHAYLSDFGLTRGATSTTGLTATGAFMGTPDYCAPEQIRSWPVDGRTDQYALACVAFVLLTGRPPFQRPEAVATLFAHLNDPVPGVTPARPDLPPAVDAVMARALAKAPGDRYASCGEFAAELLGAFSAVPHQPAMPHQPTVAGQPPIPGHIPPASVPPGSQQGLAGMTRSVFRGPLAPPATGPGTIGGRRGPLIIAGAVVAVLAVVGIVAALVLPGSSHATNGTGRQPPAASSGASAGTAAQAGGSPTASQAPITVTGTISGSGSTLQANFQQAAIRAFNASAPGVTVNYVASGSAVGRVALAGRQVLFAGSDTPIPTSERGSFQGNTVLYFPVQVGPVAVAVNLTGLTTSLRLDGPTLAAIFEGTITSWNDPAIRALNPSINLPAVTISPVARSDASTTTQAFSQFLLDAAGPGWHLGSGQTINWPGAERLVAGDSGVAQAIASTDGAIGYLGDAAATAVSMDVAAIKNKSGSFVAPSPASATAAAASVTPAANLTFQASWRSGATGYPITYQSYDLVYARQPSANDAALLKAYLGFLLGPHGQALLPPLGLGPLPASVDRAAVAQLSKITS